MIFNKKKYRTAISDERTIIWEYQLLSIFWENILIPLLFSYELAQRERPLVIWISARNEFLEDIIKYWFPFLSNPIIKR